MIEGITTTALTTLMAQGTGWVVAVLLAVVAYFLDKRSAGVQERAEQAVKHQYEKRIEEYREILDVLSEHTNTMKSMHISVSAATEAINQLAVGFAKLLREIESDKVVWGDRGTQFTKSLEDIRHRIEELQRATRA